MTDPTAVAGFDAGAFDTYEADVREVPTSIEVTAPRR
jgi:hypothetical protein